MNPRQRRGALLLLIAGLGALGVFVAVATYVSGVRAEAGELTFIYRLSDNVRAFDEIPPDLLEQVAIPEAAVPPSAVRSTEDMRGFVAGTDLAAGSFVQNDMLVPNPGLSPGEREVAILVDAETGVAGRIGPQRRVDIYATFEGETERCAALLVPGARIVAVGSQREERVRGEDEETAQEEDEVLPVTFALGPAEARKLVYAESFAQEVRLALVAPRDRAGRARTECLVPPGVGR